ncbi:MAG TPA: hypothetical protein VFK38_03475 [Candidatus Limnocylindrales bacterium]|nr:hypothetical protein [Candidatus Limnocylindrales bacterium]
MRTELLAAFAAAMGLVAGITLDPTLVLVPALAALLAAALVRLAEMRPPGEGTA